MTKLMKTSLQAYEHFEALFTIAHGLTIFITTGFHGILVHVIIGNC
jgi:hypothetical protein